MKVCFKKTCVLFLIIVELFLISPKIASAGLFSKAFNMVGGFNDILKDLGVDKNELKYQVKTFNVSRRKKNAPTVLLTFDPSDPVPGEKVKVTATPNYFMNTTENLYFTWYLKEKSCPTSSNGCDYDGDGTPNTINDYKVRAMRMIANDGFDYANFNYTNDNDDDGYTAITGGDDQEGKPEHCYIHDITSGDEYEMTECGHLFPIAPGPDRRLNTTDDHIVGKDGFGKTEEEFWHTNPNNPDTANTGNPDEANVAGLGTNVFSFTYMPGDLVGVVVEGVSIEPTQYEDASYKTMWGFVGEGCEVKKDGNAFDAYPKKSAQQTSNSTYTEKACRDASGNIFCCGSSIDPTIINMDTVGVGPQCWMKKNINEGEMITLVSNTTKQQDHSKKEKYCYDNNSNNCDTYGGLYEWYEATQLGQGMMPQSESEVQGLCPTGWRIPTDSEFEELKSSTFFYKFPTTPLGGLADKSTVQASPLDYFQDASLLSEFWTTTSTGDVAKTWQRLITSGNNLNSSQKNKTDYALSVRCIQDKSNCNDSIIHNVTTITATAEYIVPDTTVNDTVTIRTTTARIITDTSSCGTTTEKILTSTCSSDMVANGESIEITEDEAPIINGVEIVGTAECVDVDQTTVTILGGTTDTTIDDLNDCLEENMIEPTEGGGLKEKLDVSLKYSPEHPSNDTTAKGDGDKLSISASILNPTNANHLSYAWKILTTTKENPAVADFSDALNSPDWKDVTGTVLEQTEGLGLDSISFKLNMTDDIKYIRAQVVAKDTLNGGKDREGHNDILISIVSQKNTLAIYDAKATEDMTTGDIDIDKSLNERCLFHPVDPETGEPDTTIPAKKAAVCKVAKQEIIVAEIDKANYEDFLWTIDGKPYSCPTDSTITFKDCTDSNNKPTNRIYFPILKNNNDTYVLGVSAVDKNTGKRLDVTKIFQVTTPTVKIRPLQKETTSGSYICRGLLLGKYTDLAGTSHDDRSKTQYQALTSKKLTLEPSDDTGSSSLLNNSSIQKQKWTINGTIIDESNVTDYGYEIITNSLVLPPKEAGEKYNVNFSAIFTQTNTVKKVLKKLWDVSYNDFYEKDLTDAIEIEMVDDAIAMKDTPTTKIFASISSGIPEYIIFLFRIVLSGVAIVFIVELVFFLTSKSKNNEY